MKTAIIAAVLTLLGCLFGYYMGNKAGFAQGHYYGIRQDHAKSHHGQPYVDLSTEEAIQVGDLLQVLAATSTDSTQGAKDTIYLGYPSSKYVDMPEEPVSKGNTLQVLRVTRDTVYLGYQTVAIPTVRKSL